MASRARRIPRGLIRTAGIDSGREGAWTATLCPLTISLTNTSFLCRLLCVLLAARAFALTRVPDPEGLPEDILGVQVIRNIVDRPQNMTVMIEMQLREEASLPRYLNHPLHQAIGKKYNPFVEAIASFDAPD